MACLTDSWGYSRQPSCAIWLPLPRLGPVRLLAHALRPSRAGHTGGTHHSLAWGAWYRNLNQQSRTRCYRERSAGRPPYPKTLEQDHGAFKPLAHAQGRGGRGRKRGTRTPSVRGDATWGFPRLQAGAAAPILMAGGV